MSSLRKNACGALAATLLVAACTEAPLDPTGSDLGPTFSAVADLGSASSLEAPRYIVVAAGQSLPARFEESVEELGASVEAAYPELGVAVVSAWGAGAAQQLKRLKGIAFADPEPMFTFDEPTSISAPEAFDGSIASPSDPTTAFFFPRQWNMRAIDAPGAWAAGRLGSSDVTVAILDTGIDYQHADLAGRVDLSRSISFIPADDALVAANFPGTNPITDLVYHGTHVAATVVSNGLAAAGVTSGVTLIGVKVCSYVTGFCPGGAVFAGIVHAVTNGADVANMSLGGSFSKSDFPGAVSAYQRLFNWAKQHGTTFVVSAGNSAFDLDHDGDGFKTYCSVANVVCVSATGPTSAASVNGPWTDVDAPAGYSNYGRSAISVASPGGTGAGFVWAACSGTSLIIPVCGTGTFIVAITGTSMAAPHVSGTAALIVEDVGRNPAQVRALLQQSADDLGQPGTDPFYGKGRVNVAAAVGAS